MCKIAEGGKVTLELTPWQHQTLKEYKQIVNWLKAKRPETYEYFIKGVGVK